MRELLEDVADSRATHRLRAQASAQVMNFGWREGITPAEVRPYAEEAVNYAREVNDTVHGPLLLSSYGRILAARGSADEYVALAREGLSMRANDIDVMRDATLHGTLSQALWLSGRPRDALRVADDGLALLASSEPRTEREDEGFDFRRLIGFDPEHWLCAQRSRLLVWLGRFADAQAAITALEAGEATAGEVAVVKFIPHLAAAELGYWTNRPTLARAHVMQLDEYARRVRLPYLRVVAMLAGGLGSIAAADFAGAVEVLGDALLLARRANAGLEFEPVLMTCLADAVHRKGAAAEAVSRARDAVERGRERSNRVAECHATLVWAAALLDAGSTGAMTRVEPLLARAEELIEESGAVVLLPMLQGLLSRRPN